MLAGARVKTLTNEDIGLLLQKGPIFSYLAFGKV